MGMIVGRRWVYSKVGNAWAYYISKRSKYKEVVERALYDAAENRILSSCHDAYKDKNYTIITIKYPFNSAQLEDHIDSKIIEALEHTDCPKHMCKVKKMKGEGECRTKKRQINLRKRSTN